MVGRFEEQVNPHSDVPTVLEKNNKHFLAIAATCEFNLMSIDI